MREASGLITTDAVIVGAGPVGLFQVFQLGLLEIGMHVIDSLPFAGGQCMALYADKPIYDIPATPVCTGRELIEKLQQQIAPFEAPFHLGQQVDTLALSSDGRVLLETSAGTRFSAKVVIVAGGVGSFQPRRLKLDGLALFEGDQVLYSVDDAARFAGQRVMIVGDGDDALAWSAALAADGPQRAASTTLMHRREVFNASEASVAAMRALCAAGRMRFIAAQASGIDVADGRLSAVRIALSDGGTERVPVDMLLVLQGLSPKLGPIAAWGLALERKQVVVNTETFETSTPGIFAVGDVNTYPGKKKLIVSGFHEATLAAFGAVARVFPDRRVPLQYTTTSPRLHQLLGVSPATATSGQLEPLP